MDQSQFTQSMLAVEKSISAGREALTSSEKKTLPEMVNHIVSAAMDLDIIKSQPDFVHKFNEIFELSVQNTLASIIAESLNSQVFYQFGQYLLNRSENADASLIKLVHNYLDIFRHSKFLQRLENIDNWVALVRDLIRISNFNVNKLYRQRLQGYQNKTLFNVLHGSTKSSFSWKQVNTYVERYAYGLLKIALNNEEQPSKIAFLLENSLEMAMLDLACLTSGIVNIMMPANSVPQQIEFVLNQTQAKVILVYNDKQLAKIKAIKDKIPQLRLAVLVQGSSIEEWVISLNEMIDMGVDFPEELLLKHQRSIQIDDLASIMYTSGTTGEPKGIMFSHMNIVYKRFCRAMALPKISDGDRYLAFLPLFHTFGRWLEMMGAVFWGAEYAFMENPALSTMIDNMSRIKPTIFISIPKKWYQLYEYISSQVNVELSEDEEIEQVVLKATGGELRWGLSAAGYLEPDIFKFFQRYGIELMSGFGMTEATGGITMTYPGEYVENSLGKALPGIELKLGDDGELLILGDYVMMGYYGQADIKADFIDGWLPTGDIMRQDTNGFYEIIDRKKEIYKNIKGETIAPQKIENFFRDFEYVDQVFLVGDHRSFNTVLIYPNFEAGEAISKMNEGERQNYFSSLIVTVNKFLAPFERIVDYRIIDRPFSAEKGELTPKGTYKRRVIEKNFEDVIEDMYTKTYISLFSEETEVRIPNWFLREKGALIKDIGFDQNGLHLKKNDQRLTLKPVKDNQNLFQIGDYVYQNKNTFIDFQIFLANPFYWLGNTELLEFAGEAIFQWYRLDEPNEHIRFDGVAEKRTVIQSKTQQLTSIIEGGEKSLFGLNLAVELLQSSIPEEAVLAVDYLKLIIADDTLPFHGLVTELVRRPNHTDQISIQRELFKIGLGFVDETSFGSFLDTYLQYQPKLLDSNMIEQIARSGKGDEMLTSIHAVIKNSLQRIGKRKNLSKTVLPFLLNLLAEFAIFHPTKYKRVRQLIVRYQLRHDYNGLAEIARSARLKLLEGFRNWLGENQQISVDVETGKEYKWQDVIIFEDSIEQDDKDRILDALSQTSLLREAIFLFSGGNMIRLYDIPLGGIWISLIDRDDDRALYRLSVQTRFQGAYDIAINLNYNNFTDEVREEINWLIHAGAPAKGMRLLEDFGGYWQEYNLWTEEYLSGDTVAKFMQRLVRRKSEEPEQRIYHLWPFLVWTAASAHVSFWKRTGYKMELADKSAANIFIAPHDYQTGMRIISISKRIKSMNLLDLILDFNQQFIRETEEQYSYLERDGICSYIFSGVLDSEGEENGIKLLKTVLSGLKKEKRATCSEQVLTELKSFLANVKTKGFLPKNLFFAIKRFHRWYELNAEASFSAQARTLNELYDSYQLVELDKKNPETRARFYLETVFQDSSSEFNDALSKIINTQHAESLSHEDTLILLSNLQHEFTLTEKEEFFLSRLSYPHLKPTDSAILIRTQSEGASLADVVVRLEDYDGLPYLVRKPVSPKEISKLHKLFIDADLPVNFRPEHRFIVAISEREHIIGGLYYSYIDSETVYMEKIVVSSHFRRKGISEGLMHEFFNRLRDEHIQFVTTGFFRPEYFYRFGFKVERKYAGLVKDIRQQSETEEVV